MKKILFIAISSQTGGVPKHILNILNAADNYEVTVAVPNDGDYYKWMEDSADCILNYPMKPYSIRVLFELRNYVRVNRITLVHSHGKGAGMYSRPLKVLCPGIKVVHTFHGIYLERYNALVKKIYIGIERLLRKFTDVFICVSDSEKKEAMRLNFVLPKKTVVIPNGVDISDFRKHRFDRKYYEEEFGQRDDIYAIGCVARLEAMKGHQYLIHAFKKVNLKYPNSRLFLVGDGPEREAVESLVDENGLNETVIFTGFRHDIKDLMQLFDLFVSCSLKEGMPYTLLEALASGIPVAATDVIGNKDIIQDKYNGLLMCSENIEDIADKLIFAIEHPKLCQEYIKNGKKVIEEKFTVQKSLGQLFKIYQRLIGG